MSGPAKFLYTTLERLSGIQDLSLGLKGLIHNLTHNDNSENDNIICNIVGPQAPFWTA